MPHVINYIIDIAHGVILGVTVAERPGAWTHNTVELRGFLRSWDRAPGWAVICG